MKFQNEKANHQNGMHIPPWFFLLTLASILLGTLWLQPEYLTRSIRYPAFVISEIQALNWTTLPDGDEDYSDWIEIYNPHSEAQSLTGYYLTDDFKNLTKWQLPAIELEAGGFLIVFASGKDRRHFSDDLHTNFRLDARGEYLALIDPSGLRMVHEFLPKYPSQKGDDSFGLREGYFDSSNRFPKAHLRNAFYDHPSPGKPNRGEIWGQVSDLHFSRDGAFFEKSFKLNIETKTPHASIRYTLDGSEPDQKNGLLYHEPLIIASTTILRARAFREHFKPSKLSTRSFFFVSDLFSQNEMNAAIIKKAHHEKRIKPALFSLPSVSLVVPRIFLDSEIGNASFEFLHPEGKSHRLNCGARIDPNESLNTNPKASLRLIFREQYGASELRADIFGKGPKHFKSLLLRALSRNNWLAQNEEARTKGDLIKAQWMRQSHAALGQIIPRGRFVHLFLNGSYWGIYSLCERADADFMAAHLPGTSADFESRHSSQPTSIEETAWRELCDLANEDLEMPTNYERVKMLLDLDAFINFMLVELYGGASDWNGKARWFAGRRRGGKYRFFAEAQSAWIDVNAEIISLDEAFSPMRLFQKLQSSAAFRRAFSQRAHEVLDDALGQDANQKRYTNIANAIRAAMVLETARWGDHQKNAHSYESNHWETEVKRMTEDYFAKRAHHLIAQLRKRDLY